MLNWIRSGAPWIWLTGGAVSMSLLSVLGLLLLIGWKGLNFFWPAPLYQWNVTALTPAYTEKMCIIFPPTTIFIFITPSHYLNHIFFPFFLYQDTHSIIAHTSRHSQYRLYLDHPWSQLSLPLPPFFLLHYILPTCITN